MRVRQRTHALRVIWAPSRIRRVLRHRGIRAGVVVALGVAIGLSLITEFDELDQQRLEWGSLDAVLVVNQQVEPGELVAGAVEQRELPLSLLSPGSVRDLAPDSRAKVTLFPGEIVLGQRVTGSSSSADASGLASGTVALTVPIVRLVPFLTDGDLVDLWTVDSANFSSRRVANNVVVLAFSQDEITVAVSEAKVGDVTAASLRPLTITLIG